MPKTDFSQPINRADAEARRAFREVLARFGKDALAAQLEANPRTIERIGLTRDVPPGMAMDLAAYLSPIDGAGSPQGRWFAAFSTWAEDCRQRMEARRG